MSNTFKQINSITIKLNNQLYTLVTNVDQYTSFIKYNNNYYVLTDNKS